MNNKDVVIKMERSFRKQVQDDPKVHNGYLLVHSDRADIHLNVAEGMTGQVPAHPKQPNYMASVGKLFTAVITAKLCEEGQLAFSDKLSDYLDNDLLAGLHTLEGKDYTSQIEIRHLLNQTSGLPDNFDPLLKRVIKNPEHPISPREAIAWTKENATPHFPPGNGFKYTDTNYHLLGLIIEQILGEKFHVVLEKMLFKPLGMSHAYMLNYSKSAEDAGYPTASFTLNNTVLNDNPTYGHLDYAGGGVVAPLDELLIFMKALVNYEIVGRSTLEQMMKDKAKLTLGIDYGYGIWQIKTVPLLMPKKYNCWGVAGITGAFMFYHPRTESYLIGNFNESSYEQKALRFMMFKLLNPLAKLG